MSAPTVNDPNVIRPGLPARVRSVAAIGGRLLHNGGRVLWAAPGGRRSNWPGWRPFAIGVAAVAAATGVSLLRQPGAGPLDTVWAEDGTIFLADAASSSWVDSIWRPYAGYFSLGPRVLAELATIVPAAAAAATLAILAALSTAILTVLVYVASGSQLRTRLARALAAAIVVVAPLANDEVPNAIANLQWPGLYALFWLLLWTPRSPVGRVIALTATLAVATSSILAVVFLPLAIARVVWARAEARRDRYSTGSRLRGSLALAPRASRYAFALAGLLAAGVALHAIGLVSGTSERGLAPDPIHAMTGFVIRAVPATLVGQRWLPEAVNARWLALAALAWLVLIAVVVVGLRRRNGSPNWALAGIALLHAAAVYAVPVLLSGVATPRYALPAAMLLVTAIVAVLEPDAAGAKATALWIFATGLALVCAVNLRVDNPRAEGPRWSEELRTAQRECSDDSMPSVRVAIAPRTYGGWATTLPCSYVTRQ